jgi:hypothetical protein
MPWTLIWIVGILFGYAVFMSQTPLRGYFSDAFGLVREHGSAHLWIMAALLSLAGAGLDLWRQYDGGAEFTWGSALSTPNPEVLATGVPERVAKGLGDLFSTIVSGGRREIGGGVRGVMVGLLGSLLLVSAALVLQYYILLFLYVRISSPTKRIRLGKMLELALRRFGRTWPLLPVCWLVWALPLVGGLYGSAGLAWRIGMAGLFVAFAFLQAAVLSGERDLKAAIGFNFDCWRRGGIVATWFLVIASVNLWVLELASLAAEHSVETGSFPGIVLKLAFVFGRSFVLVWLAAAWLLMFCDRFIGAKRPRPK